MNRNTKKGFLSLEAAIFLPVFIIAVLTFGYLIKVVMCAENTMHIMAEEARKISMYSYNIKSGPAHEMALRAKLASENKEADGFSIDTFMYMYSHSGKDDLIGVRVGSNIKIKLPIIFQDSVDVTDTLLFRAFTGREYMPDMLDFEELEEEPVIVWVFPTAGTKYHESSCGYINVAARQGVLTGTLAGSYKPCNLCNPGELALGSVVYYFASSGGAYHKGSCFIVDRYVISMEEDEAVSKGYTPCSKCM